MLQDMEQERKTSELKPSDLCIKRFFIKTACKFHDSLTRFGGRGRAEGISRVTIITLRGLLVLLQSTGAASTVSRLL